MALSHGEQPEPHAPSEGVDAICDAFEAAWLAGQQPRIEDFLPRDELVHQDVLFRELLLAEWDLRQRHKQHPELQTYLDRFSSSSQLVENLWSAWQARQSNYSDSDMATALHTRPSEELGTVVGRYKLLEKLGDGGFGTVWAAEQRTPVKRRVALKLIKLGMDTRQVIARFEAERQALALMDHPNIAKVLDAGATETGGPYFVMELVRGIPITKYCVQENLLTQARLDLFMKVCHAIQHAHQKGIIHRDIKPSNILVTLHDGVPVPKVIDFGIAKATQQELTDKTIYTQLAQFIGTPAYMSPEQAEMSGLDIDTRSDIYSLGVLLYELLTGTTPFDADELMSSGLDAMRKIIREREPLKPSSRLTKERQSTQSSDPIRHPIHDTRHPNIDRDLDCIVMKCLEKDRSRRYETANSLAMDLKRHLENEPVVARPPSTAYRLQKAWRRNKLVYTACVAVFLALTVGLTLAAFGWFQALTQRDAAVLARVGQEAQRKKAEANEERAIQERQRAELAREETRRRAYAAEISAAFQALAENNLARAIQLLDRQRPQPGAEDLRGFEWRLLWQRCQPDEMVTLRDGARDVVFSPDGKWLAGAGPEDIVIREWPSLTTVATILHRAWPVAFSPDGEMMAGGNESEVRLWHTESWKEERLLPGARLPAVFSPGGEWLVTGAPGGYRIWNTQTWEPEHFCPGEPADAWMASRAVAFSPDGDLLVTAGHPAGRESGHQFQVWDFPSLTVHANFELFGGRLGSAAFAPDGKHLLTGREDGVLLVWNVAEGRVVEKHSEHTGWITDIEVARDGLTFATASTDRTLVVWDAATRKPLARLRGHLGEVWSVTISPDGHMLASGSKEGATKLWDATTRHEQRELTKSGLVTGFSSDSRLVVADGFKESRIWQLTDGTITTVPIENYADLHFRDSFTCRDVYGIEPQAVYGRNDGVLEFWNLATMSRVTSWQAHESEVATAVFSPDGQFIATSGENGDIKLWHAKPHREVRRFEALGEKLICLIFSPDGRLLAGSKDMESSRVGIWDVDSGELLCELDIHGPGVWSVAFSPDGKLLATANRNNTAQLWDIPSGALRATLLGHIQAVMSVAFSPDGKTLATGADDRKVKLWNIATQQEVATLDLPGWCRSVKFSPDGCTLAVGSHVEPEPSIRLWDVPSFEEIAAAEAELGADSQQP